MTSTSLIFFRSMQILVWKLQNFMGFVMYTYYWLHKIHRDTCTLYTSITKKREGPFFCPSYPAFIHVQDKHIYVYVTHSAGKSLVDFFFCPLLLSVYFSLSAHTREGWSRARGVDILGGWYMFT